MESTSPPTALVLSGALAKGAFEAGVLQALTRAPIPIVSIVGASAGALNATILAAGVRAGCADRAADRLADLWRERGTWRDAFRISVRDLVRGTGVSTSDKLAHLLRDAMATFRGGVHPIELRLVVTSAAGDPDIREREQRTSFETVIGFDGDAFDTDEGRHEVIRAATASAAFPFLFTPIQHPRLGPLLDGGAVNNAPITHASCHPAVQRVIVVTHRPARIEPPRLAGVSLLGHVADIAISERLYRDLRGARRVNRRLEAMERLHDDGTLATAQVDALKRALGLGLKRHLDIIEIRPPTELTGDAFAGLSSRALRDAYLDAGRRVAADVLARLDCAPSAPSVAPLAS
jgi:NTE family protein